MNKTYALGVIVGLLIVAIGAGIGGYFFRIKNGPGAKQYDERQEAARDKVFKASYFTLLIYMLVYGSIDAITGIVWCKLYTGLMLGALLSVTVFAVSSIAYDAYFRVGDRPGVYLALFIFIGLINLGVGVFNPLSAVIEDGVLGVGVIQPLVGLMCLIAAAATYIKLRLDRRDEEAE